VVRAARRAESVDANGQRRSGFGAPDLERTHECMTRVELGVARFEEHALGVTPATGERREGDRVTRVDRKDRWNAAREVPVQRPPF
jgi:hypothetical protein